MSKNAPRNHSTANGSCTTIKCVNRKGGYVDAGGLGRFKNIIIAGIYFLCLHLIRKMLTGSYYFRVSAINSILKIFLPGFISGRNSNGLETNSGHRIEFPENSFDEKIFGNVSVATLRPLEDILNRLYRDGRDVQGYRTLKMARVVPKRVFIKQLLDNNILESRLNWPHRHVMP